MIRRVFLALALVVAGWFATAQPAQADCLFGCYEFTNSSSDIFSLPARDCDTCSVYYVAPGRRSHLVSGGVAFHVPAGCVAKTSTFGSYWAYAGWHWFPHHTGTVTLKPYGGWRSDC